MIDDVTDDPTPEHLEQLARSVAMSGVLGDRDRIDGYQWSATDYQKSGLTWANVPNPA